MGNTLAERTYRDVLPGTGVVPGDGPGMRTPAPGRSPASAALGLRDAVPGARALPGDPVAARQALRVAYTPLHGVGLDTLLRAFARAGFAEPAVVAAQAQPDGAFPTVPRPNPEEPGVLDLLMAEGDRSGADLLLANDPDADRLAAVIPGPAGGWRVLTGDEIGALLADHRLRHESQPGRRLLVTTVVSADLLGRMAAAAGAGYAETLTGFKWIMRAADGEVGRSFLFGYEEALGYAVTDQVRDKDGMSAAIVLAGAAAEAKSEGGSLATRLDDLARRFGLFVTGQFSVELAGGKGKDEDAGVGEDAGKGAGAVKGAVKGAGAGKGAGKDEDAGKDAGQDEGAGKDAGQGRDAGKDEAGQGEDAGQGADAARARARTRARACWRRPAPSPRCRCSASRSPSSTTWAWACAPGRTGPRIRSRCPAPM